MSSDRFIIHEHDVIVIGAGGAGLRAAIEASARGCRVAVICKSLLGKAHTVMAEGGMAAAMANVDDRDSWKVHFADTMRGGQYLNNWRMAELHAKEAPERVRELEAWGAVFDRTKDGRILQRNFGGHRYPRLAHVGDRTGLEMIRTLQDHGIHQGIDVYMEMTAHTLLMDGGRVVGVFGYDRELGRFRVWKAGAVVLATGGIGRAFRITSNSWEYTGDGHALAFRAGADLMDMEFVQFHPTGMVWPPSVRGILVTEGVRGEGGRLLNNKGERFMFNDIPENYRNQTARDAEEGWRYVTGDKSANRPPELLTRDHVARCINREVKAGRGSPHGGVFLDIAWIKEKVPNGAEHIRKKLPSMYHQFKQLANVDITQESMEVGPTTHYVMGGVKVDGDTQMSTVPGLFAAGEVAAGLHGANRLGGNSLSDLVVFGKRAGEYAAAFARQHGAGSINPAQVEEAERRALEPFERGERGENPYAIQSELQGFMQDLVGIVRIQSEMEQALDKIEHLKKRAANVGVPGNREYNPGWHTAVDLANLLTVAEAVTKAAIERKESRGAQFREDYPSKSEEYGGFNIVLRPGAGGSMNVVRQPLTPLPPELKQIIEEQAK
ncbi:MAG: fumarate reductase/succinate dehydrogenase flavoprotein subunit [Phycisphaeraceae bacterium]|nr:fumarate reductase/succinate dehydrogenase flavoprotein subunit [Phycisphaerales bacterium]QOJ18800.1 MAG: fumarate reductase/succinate dehydrogenase flavoprotein subunit [Phycisphaeraceae bacterium]